MMKVVTAALGGLTALAVTGMMTPHGQALLGLQQTQPQVPVSVISDPGPVKAAAPLVAPAVRPAAPRTVAQPVVHRAPAPPRGYASRPEARPAMPAAGIAPMAGAGAITNILLNLPQVLNATQGGPAGPPPGPGPWGPPGGGDGHHHVGGGD